MPNQISNVNFSSPGFDYGADISEIERRKALAKALQDQSMQPIPEQAPGVRTSSAQGIAQLVQAFKSRKNSERAEQDQRSLAARAQNDYQSMVARGLRQLQGTPADSMPGSELSPGFETPAVAPDPMAALGTFGSHPMGQAMVPLAMQQIQREQMIRALRGGQDVPQGAGTPPAASGLAPSSANAVGASWAAGAPPAPQQAPMGPRPGGPAGGIPLEMWLQVDPTGKEYTKQLAKDAEEAGKPVVNRGYGIGTMQGGRYVADPASIEQALAMERGKAGISAQYAPPHQIPMSGGQNATIFPAEQPGIIATGQLPPRYGQQGFGAPIPSQPSIPSAGGAPRSPAIQGAAPRPATGMGTLGLTQPQSDVINQARQTTAGKAVDENFAKDYVQFTTGGAQDAAKQLAQLDDVSKALAKPGAKLSGPMIGSVPDSVLKFNETGRNAIAMRERVEEVVQRSLRAILGAQFTEKEGERLIARAYNQNLSESENGIRVGRLLSQLKQAYASKQDAARYFEKNNTLEGWKGKLPSMADFDSDAVTGKPPTQLSPATLKFLKDNNLSVPGG